MKGDDRRLDLAVTRGIITDAQAAAIRALGASDDDRASSADGAHGGSHGGSPRDAGGARAARTFDPAMIAYVLGALTVVGAMGWFLADRWKWLGPWGVLATTAVYAALFLGVGRVLLREGAKAAHGFTVLLTVALMPPAVTAINQLSGWFPPAQFRGCGWPDFVFWSCRGAELVTELATALAALVALRKVRFAPLALPLAGIAVRMIFHLADSWGLHTIGDASGGWIWVVGGSVIGAVAYATDRVQRGDEDFARFLHFAAAFCAVPASLHLLSAYEELRHFLVPGAFVAFAMALTMRRLPWLLLGMGWFVTYLVWLASEVFRDSPAFPILLAALGLGVIVATVWVQRNASMLVQRFGTVTTDGRPRFPGGVPLLLAPALVGMLLLPGAFEDDAEKRRHWAWQTRRASRVMARENLRLRREAEARQGRTGADATVPRTPSGVAGRAPVRETAPPPRT